MPLPLGGEPSTTRRTTTGPRSVPMQLSFVIPAYNEQTLIAKCLESVLAEIKRSGRDCDVVVVNNNSTDRTGEIARGIVDKMQMLPCSRIESTACLRSAR